MVPNPKLTRSRSTENGKTQCITASHIIASAAWIQIIHRLIASKIKLSLRTSKAVSVRVNYEWVSLKDSDLSDLYTATVKNRYASLCAEKKSVTGKYMYLIQVN